MSEILTTKNVNKDPRLLSRGWYVWVDSHHHLLGKDGYVHYGTGVGKCFWESEIDAVKAAIEYNKKNFPPIEGIDSLQNIIDNIKENIMIEEKKSVNVNTTKVNQVVVEYDYMGKTTYLNLVQWENCEGYTVSIDVSEITEKLFDLHESDLSALNLAVETLNLKNG